MLKTDIGGFQTQNKKMTEILFQLDELALYDVVLITGEYGSGRKLFAQELGNRMRAQRIVRYQSGLIISEIHSGDCLLVEDFESLPAQEQHSLFRMIENISSVKWIFISAHDIQNLANKGLIAKNLCQKIDKEISIEPLRNRKEDLNLICNAVLETLAWMTGKIKKLDFHAEEKIKNYNWPGNVTELEKTLEKAFLKSQGTVISGNDLELQEIITQNIQLCTLNEMERKLILQTLEITKNNKSQAARILGISIRTLRNKLTTYREEGFYESNV